MSRRLTLDEALREMSAAHSNLNNYHAAIVLMQQCMTGRTTSHADRIVRLAEQGRAAELKRHDDARAQARLRAQGL